MVQIGPSWQCVIGRDPDMVVRYHVREGVILVVENHPKKKPEQQLVSFGEGHTTLIHTNVSPLSCAMCSISPVGAGRIPWFARY